MAQTGRVRLHEQFRHDESDEAGQESCVNDFSGARVRDTNVALLDKRTIDYVNDSVGAHDIRTEHINLFVVPCYRVTCKTEKSCQQECDEFVRRRKCSRT